MGSDREARWIVDWWGQSPLDYHQLLQAKQFERSIRYSIERSTLEMVGSIEQFAERGLTIATDELREGFATVSEDLSRVESAIRDGTVEIASRLDWGFSETILRLDQVNGALSAIHQTLQTPSRTWNVEQYEDAKDYFQRGLFEEALESLQWALEGDRSHRGRKTEARFHFLRGLIRLGDYSNFDPAIVCLDLAEDAFLLADKYARPEDLDEAGVALTCAARAAYLQSDYIGALAHAQLALKRFSIFTAALDPSRWGSLHHGYEVIGLNVPALEIIAKCYAALENAEEATEALYAGVLAEPTLLAKALASEDFSDVDGQDVANEVYERYLGLQANHYEEARGRAKAALEQLGQERAFEYALAAYMPKPVEKLKQELGSIEMAASEDTPFAYVEAIKRLQRMPPQAVSVRDAFLAKAVSFLEAQKSEEGSHEVIYGGFGCLGLIFAVVFFLGVAPPAAKSLAESGWMLLGALASLPVAIALAAFVVWFASDSTARRNRVIDAKIREVERRKQAGR